MNIVEEQMPYTVFCIDTKKTGDKIFLKSKVIPATLQTKFLSVFGDKVNDASITDIEVDEFLANEKKKIKL